MTRIRRRKDRNRAKRPRRVAFGLGRIGGPDLERRLRAAGLRRGGGGGDGPLPDPASDQFRAALVRRIAMTINRWPGCPEPACRRARGCMAPRIACSNAAPDKPMSEWARARAMGRLMRNLKAEVARRRAEAGAEPGR